MAEAVPVAYEWLLALAPWESPEVLEQSLQTLAQQTWPAQRLVVSVDGELPKPLAAVLQATPLPLLVLEAPGWRGTGPTLARGLEACRCDWVLRADADDDSHPQRAEQQLRHLQMNPWVCVLGGQLKERAGSPHPVARLRHVPTEPEHLQRLLHWRNPLNHPTVALRRDAVLEAGNYRNAPGFEDWDLWLRLSKRGHRLCNLSEVLVTARVGPGHLRRRHGWDYAKREAGFLWRCGKEQLLPRRRVALLLLRLPWRLLPAPWLEALMHGLRSSR